jgi:hypothetical protein
MNEKPHPGSVTAEACTCDYLSRAAADPQVPIVFDKQMGEFHITHSSGYSLIYHCPWCGGATAKSLRETFFAQVTPEEEARLHRLTAGISSVGQALERLGPPTHDHPSGFVIERPATGSEAPRIESYRTVHFCGLSDSADVILTDCGEKGVSFSFQGKYLGPQSGDVEQCVGTDDASWCARFAGSR